MLQFVVLGYIPGTSFQFDFFQFMLAIMILCASAVGLWRYEIRQARQTIEQLALSLISL